VNNPDCTPRQRLAALEEAVALLPLMAPRHLARGDRERGLAKVSRLPVNAAMSAVHAGDPARAVELLEASRGVLVADTLDARSSDIGLLRATDAALAERFTELRARVEYLDQQLAAAFGGSGAVASESGPANWTGGADLVARSHAAHDELAALLARIRADPRLAGFTGQASTDWFAAQLTEGPVVYLVADEDRADALILGGPGGQVTDVRLGELTDVQINEHIERFLRAIGAAVDPASDLGELAAAHEEVRAVLGWLWDAVAEPVLTALGHTGPPAEGESWPRVWWCPVGRLAVLPLHAAGRPAATEGGGHSVLDRVVSSYTTTVRALAYARREAAAQDAGREVRTVIVAEPGGGDVPALPFLPAAAEEAEELAGRIPGAELLAHPGRDEVMAALPAAAVAHFACHGAANWADPGDSRLLLRDHESSPLTVREIVARRLTDARLAYLSACETMITSADLADEAVHITGALQLAGYQNVVGSLWPVHDLVARQLAGEFYRRLTAGWTRPPETERTALALHEAVRVIRDAYADRPIWWAPYVHLGPLRAGGRVSPVGGEVAEAGAGPPARRLLVKVAAGRPESVGELVETLAVSG
jgi:hypothetical protein